MNHTLAVITAGLAELGLTIALATPAQGTDLLSPLGIHNSPPLLAPVSTVNSRAVTIPRTISPLTGCAGTQAADGISWSCTFSEEFNGTSLNRSVWSPQVNFPTGDTNTHACYVDDPRTISVSGGALHLTMIKVPATNTIPCGSFSAIPTGYLTGQVSTYHTFSQQYGRFEARIRNTATPVAGLQEAYWLWPDDRYSQTALPIDSSAPGYGEIDIVETFSYKPYVATPYLHYTATDNTGAQPGLNTADCPAQRGQWNTYDLVWTSQFLAIYVNGTLCLSNTSGDSAFQKPYITLFSMAMGQANDAFTPTTPIPATLDVDYARTWKATN